MHLSNYLKKKNIKNKILKTRRSLTNIAMLQPQKIIISISINFELV